MYFVHFWAYPLPPVCVDVLYGWHPMYCKLYSVNGDMIQLGPSLKTSKGLCLNDIRKILDFLPPYQCPTYTTYQLSHLGLPPSPSLCGLHLSMASKRASKAPFTTAALLLTRSIRIGGGFRDMGDQPPFVRYGLFSGLK